MMHFLNPVLKQCEITFEIAKSVGREILAINNENAGKGIY